MTNAEKFARLNGIKWHEIKYNNGDMTCSCGLAITIPELSVGLHKTDYFTDAKSILEVMMKREDWYEFSVTMGAWSYNDGYSMKINIDYVLNPDKLLDEAIKFCEEEGK